MGNGLSSGETGINCETSGTDWEAQGAKRDLSSAPEAKQWSCPCLGAQDRCSGSGVGADGPRSRTLNWKELVPTA